MVSHTYELSRRLRQEDYYMFKPSLGHVLSSRLAWLPEWNLISN